MFMFRKTVTVSKEILAHTSEPGGGTGRLPRTHLRYLPCAPGSGMGNLTTKES